MQRSIVLALIVYLFSFEARAQNNVQQVLLEIEQNNKSLKAYQAHIESNQLQLSTGNNLPGPQVSGYYMPFGTNTTSDYTEIQVSQSFEFPTVYAARNDLIAQQKEQLQLEYNKMRQEILLKAKKYCQELIFLNRRKEVDKKRVKQARQVYDQVQQLYEKDQVGRLELNKARIAWMQDQFVVKNIDNEIQTILNKLQNLNGGLQIDFNQKAYQDILDIASLDSIWNKKLETDPELKSLKHKEAISLEQIKLAQNKNLPDLTVGYNQQGVRGSTYSGIYGGISIPLWNNRNKVKAAKAHYQYNQANREAKREAYFTEFQTQFNKYRLQLDKYSEYQNTLNELESESLLLQAYKLGEISFIEYYMELKFYRQAYDAMLQMEKALHQQKAEILKHQL